LAYAAEWTDTLVFMDSRVDVHLRHDRLHHVPGPLRALLERRPVLLGRVQAR
jgi:hypothetical protein